MALKDNINYVKNELNAQEQFLENIIKGERFFKKYKNLFIAILAIILLGIAIFYTTRAIDNRNKILANEAYNLLIKDPNNKEAKETLLNKNPSLYALFVLKNGSKTDIAELLSIKNIDPFLINLAQNELKNKTESMENFKNLLEGYELLKAGKIKEANAIFSQIPHNSSLTQITKNLQHFQGIKDEK